MSPPAVVDSAAAAPSLNHHSAAAYRNPNFNGQIFSSQSPSPFDLHSTNPMDPNFAFNSSAASPSLGPNSRANTPFGSASAKPPAASRQPRFNKKKKPLPGNRIDPIASISPTFGPGLNVPINNESFLFQANNSYTNKDSYDNNPIGPTFGSGLRPGPNAGDSNDGFVWGGNRNNNSDNNRNDGNAGYLFDSVQKNAVIDQMQKLRIESQKDRLNVNSSSSRGGCNIFNANLSGKACTFSDNEYVKSGIGIDGIAVSDLPEEIRRKLSIESEGNVIKEMNNLNIKDAASDSRKKFVPRESGPSGGNANNLLPEKMKDMKIEEDVGSYGGGQSKKVQECNFASGGVGVAKGFIFGSSDTIGGSTNVIRPDRQTNVNIKETFNSYSADIGSDDKDERKLGVDGNINGVRGEKEKVNERQADSIGNKDFGVLHSRYSEFTFLSGRQSQGESGSQVPLKHQDSATSSSTLGSSGVQFQTSANVFEASPMSRPDKKVEFSFTSQSGIGTQNIKFKTGSLKGDLYKKVEAKRESTKDVRSKKKKGKLRKPMLVLGQEFVMSENLEENSNLFESYSPMDISPYRETVDNNSLSQEHSVTAEDTFHLDENHASSNSHPAVSDDVTDEDIVTVTERLNLADIKCEEAKEEESEYFSGRGIGVGEFTSRTETKSFNSANDQFDYSTDTFFTAAESSVSSADDEVSSTSTIDRQDSGGVIQFNLASNTETIGQTNFVFAASSAAQGQLSTATRHHKKKNRARVGQESYTSTAVPKSPYSSSPMLFIPASGSSPLLSPRQVHKGDTSTLVRQSGDNHEQVEVEQNNFSKAALSTAAQEACEKWRVRGNQAYASGDLSKAEDCYRQGVYCISENETSRSCLRALMLCYSNRAATRMSLGRMREALEDCMKAASLDPSFLRVQVRAANCYLALGEVENASVHFTKCLQGGNDVCVDRKLLVEASEGLEKAQKVSDCMKQSAELLMRRTPHDVECALGVIAEALTISTHSEKLFEMKADALLMLKKYEEVILLCETTLASDKLKPLMSSTDSHLAKLHASNLQKSSSLKMLCCSLIVKSYFYLGRLEDAIEFLKKQEDLVSLGGDKDLESIVPLAGTIQRLVRHKAAGNDAFQSGRHAEAVEHYTAAISCNVESHPFAAICFCNRAAAYTAMNQITDAIADCSLAIALDGCYKKAISRRAALFEMIRDYGQAAKDLQRFVSLLERQVESKVKQSGLSDMSCVNELRQTELKLSAMEEEARKEIPLNLYLILGVDPSASASEVKKAYRKAALKHHPDKAGQSLARSENVDDALWKDIAEEVHKDADKLFKMIGEAYAVLSEPTKRSRYDLEEETRNVQSRGNGSGTPTMRTNFRNYSFGRSANRQYWQDVWRAHGSSHRGF